MKVLANDGISPSGKEAIEKGGHVVITDKVEQENLIDYINKEQIEVVLVRSATKIRKDIIDACPSIKMIGRGGVGMDNIDVDYGRSKGINVFNTPASSSQSVAELVIGQLFTCVRDLHDSNRRMPFEGSSEFKTLKKKYGSGIELRGKTLGIIGFGRIGQATAEYALGLGMNVLACDPFVETAKLVLSIATQKVEVNITTTSMDELLAQSDFISLHIPKQADGSAVIKTAELNKMKDGVVLINIARGGVINEDDLLVALNNGKIKAAALDVFENEPTPDERLLKHAKISLTPHVGAATVEAQERIGFEIADIINSAS